MLQNYNEYVSISMEDTADDVRILRRRVFEWGQTLPLCVEVVYEPSVGLLEQRVLGPCKNHRYPKPVVDCESNESGVRECFSALNFSESEGCRTSFRAFRIRTFN